MDCLRVAPPQQSQQRYIVWWVSSRKCEHPQIVKELGVGGEEIVAVHQLPCLNCNLCRYSKNPWKCKSSGEPGSNFPSRRASRPITRCLMTYASSTVTYFAVANTNPDNMCRKSLYDKKESIVQHLLTIFEQLGACAADV